MSTSSAQALCEYIREHGNEARLSPDGEEIIATIVRCHYSGMQETIIETITPTLRNVRNWLGY